MLPLYFHARYVVVEKEEARIVPEKINDDQAVFFTIAEIVMNGIRRGNVRWGESVVVYGLGLLGQLAVRFCRLCGAKPVFAVDLSEYRIGKLPEGHGIIPLNPRKDDVAEAVTVQIQTVSGVTAGICSGFHKQSVVLAVEYSIVSENIFR